MFALGINDFLVEGGEISGAGSNFFVEGVNFLSGGQGRVFVCGGG